ncbi:MAG TPA: RNA polymerase sigma factor [Solirubrobacteraceae bacterium]|nr:RNA polymerase sigma factor [Solirubrobacteraceae bacterium]
MAISPVATDGQLLRATVAGDGAAFGAFYRRHLPAVVGLLLRDTRDRELSADLSAEVFAAVLLSAARFRDRDGGSAVPWVRGIAQNKLRESRRRGRVEDRARRRLALEPEALDDDDLARVDELGAAGGSGVTELLEALPDSQRRAVRARVLDEREYGEIAAELRTSELVVRQRVSRGLARLRRDMTEGQR